MGDTRLSFQWWHRAEMRHGHGLIDQMKNLILSYKDGSVIELGENWVAILILEPVKSHPLLLNQVCTVTVPDTHA